MFVIQLKFSINRNKAAEFMDAHNQWIKSGFDDGIFLLAGSLQPGLGGAVIAHNISLADLQERVNKDPFITQKVVQAEILDIDPKRADQRLQFLLN